MQTELSSQAVFALKTILRSLANAFIPFDATLPILIGPAKGLRVPKRIAVNYPVLLLGKYESAVMHAIASLKRPIHVAYDVGAHVGLTSLWFAKAFGGSTRVIAFEPDKNNIASLESLITANPGLQLHVEPIALSDHPYIGKLYHYQGSSMGLLQDIAIADNTDVSEDESEFVSITTLDSYVFAGENPAPDLIKIDVEGAEANVLAGGRRTVNEFRPRLLIELHGPVHAAEVYDLLAREPYHWTYIHPKTGLSETILELSHLLGYFGPGDRWTQHVLLQ